MIDVDAVTAIIREAAEQEILPRFLHLKTEDVRTKAHGADFVTDADLGSERVLTERLSALLPGSLVVGEEAVYQDRAVLARLSEDAPVWVLDPLDGTGNFTQGSACFGVIVALVQGGRTRAGWLHDPLGQTTVVAEEGGGAWSGSTRLTASSKPQRHEMRVQTGPRLPEEFRTLLGAASWPKCAAHMYLSLVLDRAEVVVFRRLQPWDHAAGVLIHAEAGGVSGQILGGGPYVPIMSENGLLMTPDRETWELLAPFLERDFAAHVCGKAG